jgi:hypothetical protein
LEARDLENATRFMNEAESQIQKAEAALRFSTAPGAQ